MPLGSNRSGRLKHRPTVSIPVYLLDSLFSETSSRLAQSGDASVTTQVRDVAVMIAVAAIEASYRAGTA